MWEAVDLSHVDAEALGIEDAATAATYRADLAARQCDIYDGSGFMGGNFEFTADQWQELATSSRLLAKPLE